MSWLQDHWIVLLLLAVYSVFLVRHAIAGKRSTKDIDDYYVGGRSMGGIALGLSFFATYASTNSFVGFAGQAYTYGLPWLLVGPMLVGFCFAGWRWIAPRLRRFTVALDSVTIPDFIGFRFSSTPARVLAALIVLFASLLYMTAVFKGIGNLLETFLDLPYTVAIVIVFFIVMIYTAVGGFISVVKTDVVQGVIMMIAAALLFVGTVHAAGGISQFRNLSAMERSADLLSWDAAMPFAVLLGILIASTMKLIVEPRQLSRFYALKNQAEIDKGIWVSTLSFLVVFAMLIPIGLYAHFILPEGFSDTDLIVPTLVSEPAYFHPVAGAFLAVAMIAAAMSSLDSVLLVMATTFHRDVAGLLIETDSEQHAVRSTRIYVALFALITALIALNPPGGIVALTSFSGSLYAACFVAPLLLGLFWKKGDGMAAAGAIVVGVIVLLAWSYFEVNANIHQVFPAMGLSTLSYVSLATLPTADKLGSEGGPTFRQRIDRLRNDCLTTPIFFYGLRRREQYLRRMALPVTYKFPTVRIQSLQRSTNGWL